MAFTLSLSNAAFATCILNSFNFGLKTGGPMTMFWGWVVVGFLTIIQSLAIAEICSAYPAEGGVYYWTGVLAPKKYAPILSYFVGLTYLMATLSGNSSQASSLSIILSGVFEVLYGYELNNYFQVGFTIVMLVLILSKGLMRIDY